MSIKISYMGTKRWLAPEVAMLCINAKSGVFLDLFSGMCAVGNSIGEGRQIWSNDLQVFAANVAEANFCTKAFPLDGTVALDLLKPKIFENMQMLRSSFAEAEIKESSAIRCGDVSTLQTLFDKAIEKACALKQKSYIFDLFVNRFGCTYFSNAQCMEIDSFIFAIENTFTFDKPQQQWLKIALAEAMSRCTTSTGHFAQPLMPNVGNIKKISSQRMRSISHEFVAALSRFYARGSRFWREKNRVFRQEAGSLLENLISDKARPAIIYADPPYTKDQYSRYYHLYETLMLYDHPTCDGRGLYRPDRALSAFSHAAKVEDALDDLVRKCSALKADFVLSYPTNGLYGDSRRRIPDLITRHYKKKPDVLEFSHRHSTMGASKGPANSIVTEVLYAVHA